MSRYRVADQAEQDLRSIWAYVSERSLKGADRIIDGLLSRFNLLARNPLLGEVRTIFSPVCAPLSSKSI